MSRFRVYPKALNAVVFLGAGLGFGGLRFGLSLWGFIMSLRVGFRVWGSGLRLPGLWLRVLALGFEGLVGQKTSLGFGLWCIRLILSSLASVLWDCGLDFRIMESGHIEGCYGRLWQFWRMKT